MKELGVYEVTGRVAYRGHQPGTIFEAVLPENAEARARNRGSIRLIERVPADLRPGSYRLPTEQPQQGRE